MLGSSGDFEPGHGSLVNARHIFKLTCPKGIPGYKDNFVAVLENVAELLEVLPENKWNNPFLVTTSNGVVCLRFNSLIFQPKVGGMVISTEWKTDVSIGNIFPM